MREMGKIQDRRGILHAGARLWYGFHEDGFTSSLRAVADHIDGVRLPFEIASADQAVQAVFAARMFDLLERASCLGRSCRSASRCWADSSTSIMETGQGRGHL
jgi:predicted NAD/FAD-binding protein